MAARDRYAINVKCPHCKVLGSVYVSENDYPFMSRVDREVDRVEGNFSAEVEAGLKLTVKCKKCGKIVSGE